MASIPMPAIGPEQIKARNAALMREENEVFSRYVADQLNHRAREAAEARAQEELRRRRARRRFPKFGKHENRKIKETKRSSIKQTDRVRN